MKYLDEVLTAIMNEYDADRAAAYRSRDERVEKVNKEVPEIKNIEIEINRLGVENLGRILQNPGQSEKLNKEFEKKLAELNEKKKQLIAENNISPDYADIKYKCEKCFDTGYIDTKKCPCFIKKLINARYNMSNMGNILHDFEEFSFDYYSDKFIERLGMTEKQNMEDIYKRSVSFCNDETAKNLLFSGGCGLGKTFLSSCIAKKMMDSGKSVIYLTASGLFGDYEDYKFGRKKDFDKIIEMIYESDLLIIDDLGAEADSAMSVQFLFDIINKRGFSKKKMIISTNLNINGIKSRYTERVVSRILENFCILTFEGKDIRLQKLRKD